jgi:hypothetical protein
MGLGTPAASPPTPRRSPQYSFRFVCQQGPLELKALLLAASLRAHVDGAATELVAGLPEPVQRWGQPSSETLALLDDMGVRTEPIRNEIDDSYPIANKLSCLGIPSTAHKSVFLDSDILCVSPWREDPGLRAPFAARPADRLLPMWDLSAWKEVYAACDLKLPRERMRTSVSRSLGPPYYNAGVVAVDNGLGFAEAWKECCLRIDADPRIDGKRPWLDQLALPVAVARLGLDYATLPEAYNFPSNHRLLGSPRAALFCHYHKPIHIRLDPVLREAVSSAFERYPKLRELAARTPDWQEVLEPVGSLAAMRFGLRTRAKRGAAPTRLWLSSRYRRARRRLAESPLSPLPSTA